MLNKEKLFTIAFAFVFLIFVTSAALAASTQHIDGQIILTETQITTNESAKVNPSIYGDRIVWQDVCDGNSDIYMYNISTSKETQITTNESIQWCPDICGNRIVWTDMRNGNWDISDIYMYDLFTLTETQITTNKSDRAFPAIDGDKIVWQDRRNGNWDIYQYDLSTFTETQITTNKLDQERPDIDGDRIVWADNRNGNYDIYMYNISTSTETQITTNESTQYSPAIYRDGIVWRDSRNGDGNSDIYMYNLFTHQETQISTSGKAVGDPAINGDRIVWTDSRNPHEISYTIDEIPTLPITPIDTYDIYMYDISTFRETQITTYPTAKEGPAIYGDRIVWMDSRNGGENPEIYMCVLPPKTPTADFSASDSSGNTSLNVTFTDNSTGMPTAWNWNFGDGTNSTKQNPEHIYSTAGNYTVTLTASNAGGADTKTNKINVQSAPHTIPDGFNFLIFVMIVLYLCKKSTRN